MSKMLPAERKHNLISPLSISNLLDDLFDPLIYPEIGTPNSFKVDITEDDKKYIVYAEMPGVKKSEINISFNNGSLIISVDKTKETNKKEDNYLHREIQTSSAIRRLYLEDANGEEISAKLEHGMLKITLLKLENNNNKKRIDIK